MVSEKVKVTARAYPDSSHAGAIGAAPWGTYRHGTVLQLQSAAVAA